MATRFHLDPINWYTRSQPLDLLPSLAAAVWNDQRVRIRYESWRDLVTRDVDPLGLVLKAGIWYLVAAVKLQPRTYRVSNIQALEPIKGASKRPPRFDLSRYWSDWSRDFERRLMRESAVVKLSPLGRRILRDTSTAAHEAVEAAHTPCKPDGWVKAEIPVESVEYATRQLLRMGVEVEVLAPPELRAAVEREARAVATLYTSKGNRGRA